MLQCCPNSGIHADSSPCSRSVVVSSVVISDLARYLARSYESCRSVQSSFGCVLGSAIVRLFRSASGLRMSRSFRGCGLCHTSHLFSLLSFPVV